MGIERAVANAIGERPGLVEVIGVELQGLEMIAELRAMELARLAGEFERCDIGFFPSVGQLMPGRWKWQVISIVEIAHQRRIHARSQGGGSAELKLPDIFRIRNLLIDDV